MRAPAIMPGPGPVPVPEAWAVPTGSPPPGHRRVPTRSSGASFIFGQIFGQIFGSHSEARLPGRGGREGASCHKPPRPSLLHAPVLARGLWHGTGLVAIAALHAPGVALLGLTLAGSRCCGTVLPWSLAGAGVVLATTLALHAWLRRAVVPSLRRRLLAPLRDRLERRVAATLTEREALIHGWSDGAPGAIGLERGRLVLCTRGTRYQAVVLRPLDLWSVSLGTHRSPPSFDLCYRDPVWRRPRTVRIAFERAAQARAWARAIAEPERQAGAASVNCPPSPFCVIASRPFFATLSREVPHGHG